MTGPGKHETLVLGGARSGKSRFAEELVMRHPPPWTYLATAQALDEEMAARIAEHRARRDTNWKTQEVAFDLPAALRADAGPTLVDCATLWVSNLLLAGREPDRTALESALERRTWPVVIVSNEVGLGIVPDNALARRFRDVAGALHQHLAARADAVVLMVAGLPLTLKYGRP